MTTSRAVRGCPGGATHVRGVWGRGSKKGEARSENRDGSRKEGEPFSLLASPFYLSIMPPALQAYLRDSRAPRHSLLFALPLLLLYEVLAYTLSGDAVAGMRNGADVLLKTLFLWLGGRTGLTLFAVLLLGAGLFLAGRDWRRHGAPRRGVFLAMLGESVAYALLLGLVVGTLTSWLLPGGIPMMARAAQGGVATLDLPTQLVISLGAGIYEELLFRVLLVSGLFGLASKGLGWSPAPAGLFATVVGALVFSAFHYIGAYGDPWELGSFTFRAIAGLVFSGLYLTRGLGITAWTHALYDVFLALR